jgi:hypothetical protein
VETALQIHLGHGQVQRPFAARATLQGRRIKRDAAGLRHGQVQAAYAGLDGLRLEALDIAAALKRPLLRLRAKHLTALQLHRCIQQALHCLGHYLEAVICEQLQDLPKVASRRGIGLGLDFKSITMIVVVLSCFTRSWNVEPVGLA